MRLKNLAVILLSLTLFSCGGGSGGSGLNGGITVTSTVTGSVVNATATYTNPNTTNLIGVPITLNVQIGNQNKSLGTFSTNNSGSVGIAFSPPAFNGTQTITVIATTDRLTNFSTITMTGRSLSVTAPPTLALNATTANLAGSAFPFQIPSSAAFVTITDPFNNDLSGHTISISASVASSSPADTFIPPSSTSSNSGGTAVFPGANGSLIVPAVGIVKTMTITWTVTDTVTGLTGSGITTVTLTKSS